MFKVHLIGASMLLTLALAGESALADPSQPVCGQV